MGCLNSSGQFEHWFANIHLSGPCNRSCYWCIGQHMMALDSENNLDEWPLRNIDAFIEKCNIKGVKEINLTGTNTDPLMYSHIPELVSYLRDKIPDVKIGLRTNGALALKKSDELKLFDKLSLSIHSFNPEIYKKIMGNGEPPDLEKIIGAFGAEKPIKINVVLCPENTKDTLDYMLTIMFAASLGIKHVNLREPYGQPHVGDPLCNNDNFTRGEDVLGMPRYLFAKTNVVYWDVHYVHVESVNLYANGNISEDYPITRGHDPTGDVKDQAQFHGGRVREQWLSIRKKG